MSETTSPTRMKFNLLIALYLEKEIVSLFSHRARIVNGTVDGNDPRPFNDVHEIHKPSRELGRLGYGRDDIKDILVIRH